jgi:hypothetical protein
LHMSSWYRTAGERCATLTRCGDGGSHR